MSLSLCVHLSLCVPPAPNLELSTLFKGRAVTEPGDPDRVRLAGYKLQGVSCLHLTAGQGYKDLLLHQAAFYGFWRSNCSVFEFGLF